MLDVDGQTVFTFRMSHQQTLTPDIVETLARAYAAVAVNVPEQPKLGS